MSGRTDLLLYGVSVLGLAAAATDLIWGRIFNWMTASALVLGLAVAFFSGGFPALGEHVLAALLGLVLYGWMFWLGYMAGGDVKLLMALGAWGGLRFVEEVAILSILVGGAFALVALLLKGRLPDLSRRMFRFFRSLLVPELEVEAMKIDRKLTMPFGVPIAIAAIWSAAAHPLVSWGMPLWP